MAIGDPSSQGEPLYFTGRASTGLANAVGNVTAGTGNGQLSLFFGSPDVIFITRGSSATGAINIDLPVEGSGFGCVTIVLAEAGTGGISIGPGGSINTNTGTTRQAYTSDNTILKGTYVAPPQGAALGATGRWVFVSS